MAYSPPPPPDKLDKDQQKKADTAGAAAKAKATQTALEKEVKKAEANLKKVTDDIKRYTDAQAVAEKKYKESLDGYNKLKVLAATQLTANGGDENSHNTNPTGYEYSYYRFTLGRAYKDIQKDTADINTSTARIDAIIEEIRIKRLVDAQNKVTIAKNNLAGIQSTPGRFPALGKVDVVKRGSETSSSSLSSSSSSSSSDTTNPPSTIFKPPSGFLAYTYNLPMISNNYFNGVELHDLNGDFNTALPSISRDAKHFWSPGVSGKGALQADRILYKNQSLAEQVLSRKNSKFTASGLVPQLWGFRFLYNPETVNMGWGSISRTDPVYEGLNQEQFSGGTANLISSQLDFNLVLNRIGDFNYLDSNGLIGKNPYPTTTPPNNDELKLLYEKGTMYDIEYLFRTLFSIGTYTTYNSYLMGGVTSDPGWLPMWPVELHLGNQLRYRVRVSSLQVHHSIFNSRMIPILSTVTMVCTRFYDSVTGVGTTTP